MEDSPAGRGCGVVAGLTLIVLGGLFLAAQYVDFGLWGWVSELPWDYAWTAFVIVPGAVMLLFGALGTRETAGLAVPGAIVTTIGLILLFAAWTGRWQVWSYAWALIPAAVGLGLTILALRTGGDSLRRVGNALLGVGLVVFVVMAFFFEVVVGIGGVFTEEARRAVFPTLVILAGLFIVFSSMRRKSRDVSPKAPPGPPPSD